MWGRLLAISGKKIQVSKLNRTNARDEKVLYINLSITSLIIKIFTQNFYQKNQ